MTRNWGYQNPQRNPQVEPRRVKSETIIKPQPATKTIHVDFIRVLVILKVHLLYSECVPILANLFLVVRSRHHPFCIKVEYPKSKSNIFQVNLNVDVTLLSGKSCYSHNDPHMKSFDGL